MLLHFLCYFYWWKISICGQGRRLAVLLWGKQQTYLEEELWQTPHTHIHAHRQTEHTHTDSQTHAVAPFLSLLSSHMRASTYPHSFPFFKAHTCVHPDTRTDAHWDWAMGQMHHLSAEAPSMAHWLLLTNLVDQNKCLYCPASLAIKANKHDTNN